MAPTGRLGARIEALEQASGTAPRVLPRINTVVLAEDQAKPLLGYRIGAGAAAVDVMRKPRETGAELHQRALADLDCNDEQSIVRVVTEVREA